MANSSFHELPIYNTITYSDSQLPRTRTAEGQKPDNDTTPLLFHGGLGLCFFLCLGLTPTLYH